MTLTSDNLNEIVEGTHFCKTALERVVTAELLWAVRRREFTVANKILQMGEDVRQAISNYCTLIHITLFGFEEYFFDQCGWVRSPEWKNIEEIDIFGGNNTIKLGEGMNGMWAYGFSCQNSISGYSCGISEYNTPLTKKEAINAATQIINDFHLSVLKDERSTATDKATAVKVLKKIKELKQPKQLALF